MLLAELGVQLFQIILANGVRRIERRSFADGSIAYSVTPMLMVCGQVVQTQLIQQEEKLQL